MNGHHAPPAAPACPYVAVVEVLDDSPHALALLGIQVEDQPHHLRLILDHDKLAVLAVPVPVRCASQAPYPIIARFCIDSLILELRSLDTSDTPRSVSAL